MEHSRDIVDQCKEIYLTLIDLINNKELNKAADYMLSFINNDLKVDQKTQINFLKSILVVTKNYPFDPIKNTRERVKIHFDKLFKNFEGK